MFKKIISSLLILSFLLMVGCTSTVQLTQDEFTNKKDKGDIVVLTKDQKVYQFAEVAYRVEADSIRGRGEQLIGENRWATFKGSIALSDIAHVEFTEGNPAGSVLLLAGGILVAFVLLLGLLLAGA